MAATRCVINTYFVDTLFSVVDGLTLGFAISSTASEQTLICVYSSVYNCHVDGNDR